MLTINVFRRSAGGFANLKPQDPSKVQGYSLRETDLRLRIYEKKNSQSTTSTVPETTRSEPVANPSASGERRSLRNRIPKFPATADETFPKAKKRRFGGKRVEKFRHFNGTEPNGASIEENGLPSNDEEHFTSSFNHNNNRDDDDECSNPLPHSELFDDVYEFADNAEAPPLLRPMTNGHTPPKPHCLKLRLRMKRSPIFDEIIEVGSHLGRREYEVLNIEGDFQYKTPKRKKRKKHKRKFPDSPTSDSNGTHVNGTDVKPRMKTVRLIMCDESRIINIASTDLLTG